MAVLGPRKQLLDYKVQEMQEGRGLWRDRKRWSWGAVRAAARWLQVVFSARPQRGVCGIRLEASLEGKLLSRGGTGLPVATWFSK